MSLELPAIPAAPNEDSTPEQWARYLQIVALHNSAASTQAIRDQTAQMALMTAAAVRSGDLMQQLLDQPSPPPAPSADSGAARVAMASLLSESTDRPPAEVATAVLARVAAVDSMLGGVQP